MILSLDTVATTIASRRTGANYPVSIYLPGFPTSHVRTDVPAFEEALRRYFP